MRACVVSAYLLFAIVVAVACQPAERDMEPVIANLLYLGESLPGQGPQVFADGHVSNAGFRLHGSPVFSPDLREIYWSVIPPAIISMSLMNATWSEAIHLPLLSHHRWQLFGSCTPR
jgi:prepilin-type processing-associated H-X9-DG protein